MYPTNAIFLHLPCAAGVSAKLGTLTVGVGKFPVIAGAAGQRHIVKQHNRQSEWLQG